MQGLSLTTVKRAEVESNQVWNIHSVDGHRVRLGSHITCSCERDFDCSFFTAIVARIWKLDHPERTVKRSQLIHAATMPQIECLICQDDSAWAYRGAAFSFCVHCLCVFHKSCIVKWNQPLCIHCRQSEFLPFGVTLPKQSVSIRFADEIFLQAFFFRYLLTTCRPQLQQTRKSRQQRPMSLRWKPTHMNSNSPMSI